MIVKTDIPRKYSPVASYEGFSFRYNYDENLVEMVQKASKEDAEMNREWKEKYGYDLYKIGVDGYYVVEKADLIREFWEDEDQRAKYLDQFVDMSLENLTSMVQDLCEITI